MESLIVAIIGIFLLIAAGRRAWQLFSQWRIEYPLKKEFKKNHPLVTKGFYCPVDGGFFYFNIDVDYVGPFDVTTGKHTGEPRAYAWAEPSLSLSKPICYCRKTYNPNNKTIYFFDKPVIS